MGLQLANDKTLLSGVIFAAVGAAAIWFDQNYALGTATAMGPGYFPMLIGVLLVVLGLCNIVQSLRLTKRMPLTRPALRPLLLLSAGVIVFGLIIDVFGLLPAIFCLVLCCSFAGPRFRLWEALAVLVVLSAIAGSLFVFGLGLPTDYLIRF